MSYIKFKNELPKGFIDTETPPFDLEIWVGDEWKSSDTKILYVFEHVDSEQLKSKKIMSPSVCTSTFHAIENISKDMTKRAGIKPRKVDRKNSAYINFNFFKTYTLKGDQRVSADQAACKRVLSLIKKLEPTLIVIFGDYAASSLLELDIDTIRYKRGWVHKTKFGPCVTTIGFEKTYVARVVDDEDDTEDDDDLLADFKAQDRQYEEAVANSNLVSYIAQTIAPVFSSTMLYQVDKVVPNYKIIDSVKKFDKLLEKLYAAPLVAVDCETEDLTTYNNNILILQFALDEKTAYILPLYHSDTPNSSSDIKYYEEKLKAYFSQRYEFDPKKPKYFLGANFGFDQRIIKQWLGIRHIHIPTWCVIAAEFVLDENRRQLLNYGNPLFNLGSMLCFYGDDYYQTADFSKGDRKTIKDIPLTESLYKYCAVDVQCLFTLHKQQLVRASHLPNGDGNYKATYWRLVLTVMSSIVGVQSRMEHRGSQLDIKLFLQLLDKTSSPIYKRMQTIPSELMKLEPVIETNKRLMKNTNAPTKGLFGTTSYQLFDPNTVAHKQMLFFEVLKLKPLKTGANGPSMNKAFQKAYKSEPSVTLIGELARLKTIFGTYIKGWYKKISATTDGAVDGRLRPKFGYKLVTGRSNSTDPNLQNVPQHSSEAKYVKQLFRAPIGYLKLDADYSAHEVRVWALISSDDVLAEAFRTCLRAIYTFRNNPTPENYKRKQLESDIHKAIYSLFTGTPILEITPTQRQDAKGIGFGSIYGIGMKALAESIKRTIDETKTIVGSFFGKFVTGKKWLDGVVTFSKKHLHITSPIGRRRNLPGYVIDVPQLTAALERRSKNSPIQGFGSDLGYVAAEVYSREMDKLMDDLSIPSNKEYFESMGWSMNPFDSNEAFSPSGTDTMVHDSIKNQVRYDLYLISIHLLEWSMVVAPRDFCRRYFGFEFSVDLAVEMDIGSSADAMEKWEFNWTPVDYEIQEEVDGQTVNKKIHIADIKELVLDALNAQVSRGIDIKPKKIWKQMEATYLKHKKYLDKHYPIPAHLNKI